MMCSNNFDLKSKLSDPKLCSISVILLSIVFIFSPFLSIFLCAFLIAAYNVSNKGVVFTFIVLLAIWMSAINATKEFASDQIFYAKMFYAVPKYDLWEALVYLSVSGEHTTENYAEPVYKLICWIGYYVSSGNAYWYFSFVTFLIYIINFYSIYRFKNHGNNRILSIITCIMVCAFFFQYFNQTNHAIRQLIGTAFAVCAIVLKSEDKRNHWILYMLALLSHKSTFVLVILGLIPFDVILKRRNMIFCIIITSLCTVFMSSMASAILQMSASDSYLLKRAALDSKEFSAMNAIVLYGVTCPMIFVSVRELFIRKLAPLNVKYFCFVSLLFEVFIISCWKNTLFQGRFFFTLYALVPYILPMLFDPCKRFQKNYKFSLILLLLIHFFYSFSVCIWKYANVSEILSFPIWMLFNYNQ